MIHRRRFVDLGGFDDQLRIWGGENIEISGEFTVSHQLAEHHLVKNWRCGGSVKLNPCARVGHIERQFKSHEEKLEIDFDRYSRKGNVTIGLGFFHLRSSVSN